MKGIVATSGKRSLRGASVAIALDEALRPTARWARRCSALGYGAALLVPLMLASACYHGAEIRGDGSATAEAEDGDDGGVGGDEGSGIEPSCDLQEVFARPANNCTAQGCHGVQHVAGLDLESDLEGLGARLVNKPSATAACGDRLLIDPLDTDRSLMLTQLTPEGVEEGCGVIMPLGGTGVSDDDFACIKEWVEYYADTTEPEPEVDYCDEFEAASPRVYVSKVKTLMTGLRATAEEVEMVEDNPAALVSLAHEWIEFSQFEARLQPFLEDSLQFSLDLADLDDKIDGLPEFKSYVESDIGESFRRTMMRIIQEDRPFTEIATTRQWEVTTFTLAILAYLDAGEDERKQTHTMYTNPPGNSNPTLEYSIANKVWKLPSGSEQCSGLTRQGDGVLTMMLGRCKGTMQSTPAFEASDFTDWRTVELVPSANAEPEPVFWDLISLRNVTTQMEVGMPRVGFLTHPAFLARWETNEDNQFRVTTNQAVMVMTGHTFEASDSTEPLSEAGLDPDHADPQSACYQCHRALDPMRVFYQNAYDYDYTSLGLDHGNTTPGYAFRGEADQGGDLYDFADLLAENPDFSAAWTQKLCYWANSQACDVNDPEFQRVAGVFEDSGYSFKTLMVELLTSPLVTGAEPTETYCSREFLVSITRRDQLCQSLEARLGLPGVCDDGKLSKLVELIPEDSIARGDPAPVQNPTSSAFHAAGVEQFCAQLALDQLTLGNSVSQGERDAALTTVVEGLMGIPAGTPRYDEVMGVLNAHVDEAIASVGNEGDAVRSAFTLGCMSSDLQALGL